MQQHLTRDDGSVPCRFPKGQYVELLVTIPSTAGGSVEAGTRGIVQAIDLTRPDDDIYLVAFLRSEQVSGNAAWLREIDVFRA
jgi:hypothetical protein